MQKLILMSKLLLIIAVVTIGFTACQKNKLNDETEAASAQNFNAAEIEDDNAQIMADQAESNNAIDLRQSAAAQEANLLGCATVTKDSLSSPKKITIDFGSGCTNANGVTRKGKIFVTYTGAYRAAGTVIHITSEDYYVNSNKVDIDRTVTNNGENAAGHLTFSIVANRKVTFTDGTFSTSSTDDKVREWMEGSNTPHDFSDDVYKVTGTGTHTSRKGIVYDVSILTALTRKVSCHQFTAGDVKIIRHGQRDRYGVIDFGNGDCDDEATVTLDNGRVYTISLRH
ncbi:MAG: hypothetical protein U0U67_01995 [Chitinophagales bacterium]